jgi:hypothetical protein
MEGNGQLQAPAAFPPGKGPPRTHRNGNSLDPSVVTQMIHNI